MCIPLEAWAEPARAVPAAPRVPSIGLAATITSPLQDKHISECLYAESPGLAQAPASQPEKELTEPPASSKRISFPSSSESPLPFKWSKTSEETKSEQMYQCPYCKYSNTDVNRLRVHAMTQHSVQPMLRCPLCQDMLNNKIHLQLHLTHLHSVSPDCVEKLIMTHVPCCLGMSTAVPTKVRSRELLWEQLLHLSELCPRGLLHPVLGTGRE
ncbi:hypothetical protein DV515_00015123 [Chloebia gouldiae]|uniref:C2H2-type domain-containing protein n=1 Tax=Chloebia gouldiae TaxID=44316 RepID=A0A3L8RXD7_CHLGU|nr:hypothetical protein DV515_00015123 [Chloebia gouldiae]